MLSRHRNAPGDPAVDPPHPTLRAGRRTLVLLTLVALIGAPAAVLRAFCVGHSCDETASASSEVPFCSLPEGVRSRVAAGFREGRSPDVLAVTAGETIVTGEGAAAVPWPSTTQEDTTRVPIAFWGTGITPGAEVPAGTGVDDIAPTIAEVLGFDRPHPEVRSGTAVPGVASGDVPGLVVAIVWVGRGSEDVAGVRSLDAAMEAGAATLDGDTVSVPVDPAAVLTTIGTGGRPAQHGVTGGLVRDDDGALRKAWTAKSPVSVIATLGDDLDEELRGEPVIGMAGGRRAYRGAIGGNWYIDVDRDRFVRTRSGEEASAAAALLRSSFGGDAVADLAVVAVEGGPRALDRTVRRVEKVAEKVSGGSAAFVFTATGATPSGVPFDTGAMPGDDVAGLVEATAPGGLFLDQKELAEQGATADVVLRSLQEMRISGEDRLFADVFPEIAVAFGRYC